MFIWTDCILMLIT